jgi:CheY-like chemotaxis protein
MSGRILVAGVDARELRLEVRFLQREPDLVQETLSARELLDELAKDSARLVVLGPRLPDVPLVETIQRIREGPASRRVSILVMVPASEPPGTEGVVLGAGANAALRRPLDRFVLESWVSKLVDVPNRVLARIPVHVQVVGSRHGAPGEHFYGLSRNLSVHGMLLASPVRIEAQDLDLEIDLPEAEGRVRVLGRVAREAPEVGWPYVGYGIEFLFLPEAAQRVIDRMVRRAAPREPPRSLWTPGAIHSTLRRDEWIYEILEPVRFGGGWQTEIRRGPRLLWRPGASAAFYVVDGSSRDAVLERARAFVLGGPPPE